MSTGMVSTAAQKNDFQARLARIESGAGSSKATLFVGLDETVQANTKANAKLIRQAAAVPPKRLGAFEALICAFIGAASLGLAQYVRFTLADDVKTLANPEIDMAINASLALAISVFLGYFLRFPLLKMLPVAALAVLASTASFHNLVHFYPDRFAAMFSPQWVQQVVTTTKPHSIIWRGASFTL